MVETKTYNCTICGLTFSRKYHLDRHTETKKHIDKVQNIATTKTHCCTFCNKSFSHSSSLSKHRSECKKKIRCLLVSMNWRSVILKTKKK